MGKTIRLAWMIGIAAAAAASFGQQKTATWKYVEEEESSKVPLLEFYEDPPWMTALSPFSSPGTNSFASFNSIQINVNAQGQNITNDAANEPSFCVDPTNPNIMAVGWRQFNNKSSNFRQGGWAFTTNHGQSWTFPGILENNVFRSDPVLACDATGKFYYLSLLETFYDDIWMSLNGGVNFTRVAPATGGDKQWFTIDRSNSIGRGNMYQTWSTAGNNWGGRQFSRSTDGGVTWSNPIHIPFDMVWGVLDVFTNGDLYICGTDGGNQFYFARSSNAKDKNQSVTFDLSRQLSLGGSIIYGAPVNPAGLGGQTWLAVDKSGGPTNGLIYILASVERNATNPADVMLSRTVDGGNSWSSPIRVNDDVVGSGKYHWFGTLSVAPNGRVDVCWYDTRNSSNNSMSELWYSYSLDGGLTFAQNVRVSNPFNQSLGYPNQSKIGDYIGMISDNSGANIVYSATFNGEQDVYYVRVEAAPELALPDTVSLLRGTQVSGGVQELSFDDSQSFVSESQYFGAADDPIALEVTTHTTKRAPSGLQLNFNGRVAVTGLTQKLSLYNYQAQAYELVDSRPGTKTDSSASVNLSGDLSRFIDQSTGEMKAKLSYGGFHPSGLRWRAATDSVNWVLTP